MKLRIASAAFLLAFSTISLASPPPKDSLPARMAAPGKFYVGIFGGGGSSGDFNATQYGTAYLLELQGGPLAVNAFGQLGSQSASYFGGQIGYQVQEIFMNTSSWTLTPAVELEGLSMSNSTFSGTLVNNSARLPEHDFAVSYPMSRNVFLLNGVITFNNPSLIVHPYIGLGIGDALLRISGATATQTNPPEAGVNHYNSNPSDSTTVFAGQFKLGLGYDFNQYVSVFADYRWVYIANSQFTLGSTIFPGHAETSSWQVNMDSQRYNMGDVGVRFSV